MTIMTETIASFEYNGERVALVPAKMQPVIGTTNPDRVAEICRASDVVLSREEWYGLYRASGKTLP